MNTIAERQNILLISPYFVWSFKIFPFNQNTGVRWGTRISCFDKILKNI